jgi:hypothetical protein
MIIAGKDMKKETGKYRFGNADEFIRVVEDRIPPEVFLEFHRYLEENHGAINSKNIVDIRNKLVQLSQEGTIESYRKIEEMIKNHSLSSADKDFAIVALAFCRFSIENELLDIPTDMISGGLGGMSNKIRYYVALTGKDGLSENNYKDIESVFNEVLSECDSVLEQLERHDFYVSLLILGSIDYAVGNILDTALGRCGFLEKDYYLTNVEIPNDERIRDWLDGKLDESEQEYIT